MKTNKHSQLTRRNLLKVFLASGISKAVVASSPLVSGLLYSRAIDAQEMSKPYRSAVIFIPGGGIHNFWAPSGSGDSMQMASMSQGYDSVKTQCNFLLNMSHENAGHGRQPRILSDRWGGSGADSYDVFMGKQLGPSLPFTYVNLGVHSNGQGYLTREGSNQIPFQDNPFTVFNLLFGDNSGGSQKTPILDIHANAARAIRSKLAGYEVHRMESHLDAISDTQRRLDDLSGGGPSCSAAPHAETFPLSYDTFSEQARLQADIAVAALKCNLTSSVSLAFGNHQCNFRIPGLSYSGSYHQSIHGGSGGRANYPNYVEMRNHLGSLSAYFIKKLEDEGILDSTIVVETTDMGHADQHGSADVPLLIAGGGNAINKAKTTAVGSSYHNLDLLHTSAKACGVDLSFGREIPGVLNS